MKKTHEKRRETKKGLGRLRGLVALMLAMVIAVGFMPMQNVRAISSESYYLICYEPSSTSGATAFLGTSADAATDWYNPSNLSGMLYYVGSSYSGFKLGYYKSQQGVWHIGSESGMAAVHSDMTPGSEYSFTVTSAADLYFGYWNDSCHNIFVQYNGYQEYTDMSHKYVKLSKKLPAGDYKINYSTLNNSTVDNLFIISRVITEITLSDTTLELKPGDPAKTLTVTPEDAAVVWHSSNTAVATVSSGAVTAVADGTAVITATLKDDPNVTATCNVTVKSDKKPDDPAANTEIKKGDQITDASGNDTGYIVENPDKDNFEATYKGTASDKKAKKVRILDEVKDANGNVFKVTTIENEALKNAKGKELIIGKNIKKIGKRALKNAKFRKITLRTDKKGKIKIGKNAFKVKNKKCVIKLKGVKGKNKVKLANKILKQATDGVTVK